LALSACNKYSKVLKSKDVAYKLSMADKYYEEKKYRQAQQLYEELYPVFKGTESLKICTIKMHTVFIIWVITGMPKTSLRLP
jgi:hypothetical protein